MRGAGGKGRGREGTGRRTGKAGVKHEPGQTRWTLEHRTWELDSKISIGPGTDSDRSDGGEGPPTGLV